eukprot:362016-Chlamydomonas_euryale.AAC.2
MLDTRVCRGVVARSHAVKKRGHPEVVVPRGSKKQVDKRVRAWVSTPADPPRQTRGCRPVCRPPAGQAPLVNHGPPADTPPSLRSSQTLHTRSECAYAACGGTVDPGYLAGPRLLVVPGSASCRTGARTGHWHIGPAATPVVVAIARAACACWCTAGHVCGGRVCH